MTRLSIIIAVKDGASNLPALLGALDERSEDTEVIVCSAGPVTALEGQKNLSVITLPAGTLIPSLWSEGIARARGAAVALTTAQFVPKHGWLQRISAVDLQQWVGVGGAIDNDPAASTRNWAIYFLRYSAFARPLQKRETDEIAADNAVYDRAAIMEHLDLLREGFWEPSFHRRFHAAGRKLLLDPELVVVHHGTISAPSFMRQRYLHGRAYGIERAARGNVVRNVVLLVSSPFVTPLLLTRIARRIVNMPNYRSKLLPVAPWLVCFTMAWTLGEASGYLLTIRRGRRTRLYGAAVVR